MLHKSFVSKKPERKIGKLLTEFQFNELLFFKD